MDKESQKSAEELIEVCRLVYRRGLIVALEGNISLRLAKGTILITPTSVCKEFVEERELVEVNLEGNVIKGTKKPTSELAMHLFIYRERPDVNAVVHCHPPYATGFAAARMPLNKCVLPEIIIGLGGIPLADYATPSTQELSESIRPYVKSSEALLLSNHGAVTFGRDIFDAFYKMESVEHAAHITFVARCLGGEKPLSKNDVKKLEQISVSILGTPIKRSLSCSPCE
jgi:L-fuculose-phosphate aldolase